MAAVVARNLWIFPEGSYLPSTVWVLKPPDRLETGVNHHHHRGLEGYPYDQTGRAPLWCTSLPSHIVRMS